MYLQIPVKLERYVDEIKRRANDFTNEKNITLMRIGTTKSTGSVKMMFVIYNPFPIPIKVNPNFFESSSLVYKMYPSEFTLGADSLAAFILFSSEDVKVTINEEQYIMDLQQNIAATISNSRFIKQSEEQVLSTKTYKVDANQVELDKTILLDDHIELETDFKKYKLRDDSNVDVILEQIEVVDKRVCLELNLFNSSNERDLILNGLRIKIYDQEHKIHVGVKEEIKLKNGSSKKIKVYVNKIEFDQIIFDQMQLKVTII